MSVNIEVNEDYKIGVDQYNWIVYRLGTVKDEESKNFGQPTEKAITFNSNLINSVKSIVDDIVRREADGEVCDTFGENKQRLDEAIGWYQGKQEHLVNLILSRKEELKEALKLNKAI